MIVTVPSSLIECLSRFSVQAKDESQEVEGTEDNDGADYIEGQTDDEAQQELVAEMACLEEEDMKCEEKD